MRTTIDAGGRIVIPKSVRERLGFAPGEEVELRERDGLLEVEVAPSAMSLVTRKGGVVAVPERPLPPLTDEIVRETIERVRR